MSECVCVCVCVCISCLTVLEVGWVADQYIVPEDKEDEQKILINVGKRIQNPLNLKLTGSQIPDLDPPYQATPGQDFVVEAEVAVPSNAFQEYSVSIADVIINDNRVENLFQNFTLTVEIVVEGAYFDAEKTTVKTAEIDIEDDDSKPIFTHVPFNENCCFLYSGVCVSDWRRGVSRI